MFVLVLKSVDIIKTYQSITFSFFSILTLIYLFLLALYIWSSIKENFFCLPNLWAAGAPGSLSVGTMWGEDSPQHFIENSFQHRSNFETTWSWPFSALVGESILAAQNGLWINHGNPGIYKCDPMAKEWWVLFPLEDENIVRTLVAAIPHRWRGDFHRPDGMTLGEGWKWLCSPAGSWPLAPGPILLLASSWLHLQNEEVETHQPDGGWGWVGTFKVVRMTPKPALADRAGLSPIVASPRWAETVAFSEE